MAVAFDAKATTDTAQNLGSSPVTNTTLTIGASATALVAVTQISVTSGAVPTCTGMTWNGVAMTLLGSKVASDGFQAVYVFGLASPATGNKTLSASYSGAVTSSDIYLDCASFTGTDTTTANAFPSGNVLTDASTPTGTTYPTAAFSVTTVSGDAALAAMQNTAALYTGVAAGTLLRDDGSLNGQCTWGFHLAVGASTTEQFTGGAAGNPCCGVAIRIAQPAAAASPIVPNDLSRSSPAPRKTADASAGLNLSLVPPQAIQNILLGQIWM